MSTRLRHTQPLFVFDWDDVISQTDKLRELSIELLNLSKLPEPIIIATRDELLERGGYNFYRHAKLLAKRHPDYEVGLEAVMRIFEKARDRLGSAVYPDAERFLRRLHGTYSLAIITIGDPEFQQGKVARTGLASLFDHMVFLPAPRGERAAPEAKARVLGQFLEFYPRIFYFEDQPKTIAALHEKHGRHGRIVPIRVDRKLESTLKYPNIIRHFDEFDLDRWVAN